MGGRILTSVSASEQSLHVNARWSALLHSMTRKWLQH
jgi:hypothetical protein